MTKKALGPARSELPPPERPNAPPARVTLEVLASRLLDDEQEAVASSSSDLELEEDPSWRGEQNGTERPVSAMTLQSVARAQQALHKPIPFVRGGRCVEFTGDDITRLRDADTLRYLQENSHVFTQHTRPRRSAAAGAAAPPKVASPDASAATNATSRASNGEAHGEEEAPLAAPSVDDAVARKEELEAQIAELQREIETFITAVDDDGHTYEIHMHHQGVLQVPVDVEAELDVLRDGAEEEEGEGEDSGAAVVAPNDTVPPASGAVDLDATEPVRPPSTRSAVLAETDASPSPASSAASRTPGPPRTAPSAKTSSRRLAKANAPRQSKPARTLVTDKPPSMKVRTARQLSEEEELRVTALLDGTVDLRATNPYCHSDEAMIRMAHLDNSLEALRSARGAAVQPHVLDTLPSASAAAAEMPTAAAHASPRVDYLAEAKATAKVDRRMQTINNRLLRIEREMAQLAVYQDTINVPADVLAARPAWARGVDSLTDPALSAARLVADDALVEKLLAEAAREQERAESAGIITSAVIAANDPFVALRTDASVAASRASELLAQWDSAPLALTELSDPENPEDELTMPVTGTEVTIEEHP